MMQPYGCIYAAGSTRAGGVIISKSTIKVLKQDPAYLPTLPTSWDLGICIQPRHFPRESGSLRGWITNFYVGRSSAKSIGLHFVFARWVGSTAIKFTISAASKLHWSATFVALRGFSLLFRPLLVPLRPIKTLSPRTGVMLTVPVGSMGSLSV